MKTHYLIVQYSIASHAIKRTTEISLGYFPVGFRWHVIMELLEQQALCALLFIRMPQSNVRVQAWNAVCTHIRYPVP